MVVSKNDADSGMRVLRSIQAHDLAITRGVFRGGRDPWPFLPILHCDLFLSAEPAQVLKAKEAKVPAALIMAPPRARVADESEVRIAFDGDAVLFDDESQRIYDREGLLAFQAHEATHAEQPLEPGPFRPFLEGLSRVQSHFPEEGSPIRTALVTARDAPAHFRVINTLRSWNVRVDETYFLGGLDKTAFLEAFGAHIFFDDQLANAQLAAQRVPSAQVVWPSQELGAPNPAAPLAAAGKTRRPKARADQLLTFPPMTNRAASGTPASPKGSPNGEQALGLDTIAVAEEVLE